MVRAWQGLPGAGQVRVGGEQPQALMGLQGLGGQVEQLGQRQAQAAARIGVVRGLPIPFEQAQLQRLRVETPELRSSGRSRWR